jgi:deoxycytidylate deaminase
VTVGTTKGGMVLYTAIDGIYDQRANFIIIGLTGRVGSGCSTIANYMSLKKEDLNIIEATLGDNPTDNVRKRHVIYNFFKEHWEPFTVIRVKDIISSFVLESDIEDINNYLKKFKIDIKGFTDWKQLQAENNQIFNIIKSYKTSDIENLEIAFKYLTGTLPDVANKIKHLLEIKGYRTYSKIFQALGDNIRKSGKVHSEEQIDGHIYSISQRVNSVIKIIRKHNQQYKKKDYFVIDAIRNPFEALFFRERYSSFYLFSIKCPEDDRQDRLVKGLNLQYKDIKEQDDKENPKGSPTKSFEIFVSQNIRSCIEKSDIHLINKGGFDSSDHREIKGQIVKYVSLIQHPGLITPTDDEKLMQIAFVAKLNSGCISRQVGAVVTNTEDVIVAVGWNDVPKGQVACVYRSMKNLNTDTDAKSFSEYEKTKEFKKVISLNLIKYNVNLMKGKHLSYCFKDIQNDIDSKGNQVFTRAIHAEENAFLQISKYGGQGVKGGTLYTTASPCELCSKKSYHLGIKRIVYIEPYPGIAEMNILKSGTNPPSVELYAGAIGQAYIRLYEPLLPYKDELKAYELDSSKAEATLFE